METNAVNPVVPELQNGTAAAPVTNVPQTLADVIGAGETPAEQQPSPTQEPAEQLAEPGYVGRRIQQARKAWDSEHQGEITRLTERTNALMERVIAREAQDLVASGEFKTLERATEYLRLKEGMPAPVGEMQQPVQPRDAQGRFAAQQPQNANTEYMQRAQFLTQQAEYLQRATGVDVMALYNTNPEARQMVLAGGDFADVLKTFGGGQPQPMQQQAPVPVRSANGVAIGKTKIGGMTDTQFASMNDFLAKGGTIDMR